MQKRPLKLRWRKQLRKSQRQVEDMGTQAEENLDKHLFKRFDNLIQVRRFALIWTGVILALIIGVVIQNLALTNYYQVLSAVPGGIYSEGLSGSFTDANPIYATADADTTVSKLVFAGLLQTSANGNLVGDLASGYSVDSTDKVYTVRLKPNLKWQDGKPLTASDVVFTFKTIQNPDALSPLFSSWQGIQISAPNPTTVVFKLPDVLASFPYELTTGILPQHILGQIPAADLRSDDFNTVRPVGAGPFTWQALQVVNGSNPQEEEVQIALKPFANYQGGRPKLDEFILDSFADQDQLVTDFQHRQLTAMEAVTPPPAQIQNKPGVVKHSFILRAANMVFFKTTSSGLLSDQTVRQALIESANTNQIISDLGYKTIPVIEPLLMGQLAYNPAFGQSGFNPKDAANKLTGDGWLADKSGIRQKNGQPLSFTLTLPNTVEDMQVASELKQQWRKVGVEVLLQPLGPTDFQSALSYHDYDAVLAAIDIGTDPDVFVYWDSSQADIRSTNRLNFSEFSDPNADEALEAGRTRLDPALRVIKYQPFLEAWQQDAPALGLYQPRLLYLTNGPVANLDISTLTTATDRFANVQNWEIRQARVTR